MKISKLKTLGAILAVGHITTINLVAQTSWNSSADGLWSDSANWSAGIPASNRANIANAGSKTVTLDNTALPANLQINSFYIEGSGNKLRLTNSSSTLVANGEASRVQSANSSSWAYLEIAGGNLNTAGQAVEIGRNYNGQVDMSSGTWIATDIRLGSGAGSRGILNQTGGSITINKTDANNGILRVGTFKNTSGSLTMTGGYLSMYQLTLGQATTDTAVSNTVDVSNGAILDVAVLSLNRGTAGTATASLAVHDGGVLQFSSNTPVVDLLNGATASVNNSVVSYRGVSNVQIHHANLAPVSLTGNNAFRLNSATTRTDLASYTFNAGGGNYQALQLTGTGSQWTTTGTTTIGTNGELYAFNATNAVVNATLQNDGTVRIENSQVSFTKNVTVASTGALRGDASAVFDFQGDVALQSTNEADSDLNLATFRFSGSGNHTLNLTGSGFSDDGVEGMGQSNFNFGILKIDASNSLILTGAAGINALYIGQLNLTGWDTTPGGLNASLTNALNLGAGVNIYYNPTFAQNAYLNGETYDLWGGGRLISAVPEASSIHLLLAGLALLALLRRKLWSA